MKIPQAKLDMLRITADFARDAIKLSAIGNGGGIIYVFNKQSPLSVDFKIGAAAFMAGFFFCVVSAIFAYLAQCKYGVAIKYDNGKIEINESINNIGHFRRKVSLIFLWLSVTIPVVGCVFVLMGNS